MTEQFSDASRSLRSLHQCDMKEKKMSKQNKSVLMIKPTCRKESEYSSKTNRHFSSNEAVKVTFLSTFNHA